MCETQFGSETRTASVVYGFANDGKMGSDAGQMDDAQSHTKQLVVSKVGYNMVPLYEGSRSGAFNRFQELFKRHRLKTMTYCSVFWSFGMCVAFLGPTLLDLECRTDTVFSTMSWVFFSQSFFTLIGSACGGFLVSRIGIHHVLLASTGMLALTLAVIPSCSVLGWLTFVLAVMGFFMGTIETVANISMIKLYGKNVAPFLQAMHFCYGFGAFLSPLIAEPFLLHKDCTSSVLSGGRNRFALHLPQNLSQPVENILESNHYSRIQYAFWIMSLLQTPVIGILLLIVRRELKGLDIETAEERSNLDKDSYEMQNHPTVSLSVIDGENDDRPNVSKTQITQIVICAATILFLYDGLQAGYGGYLFSYAVKSISGMSRDEAAYMNALFWGTFSLGRLLSIGISTRLAPTFMLFCNIIGSLFAMTLMICFRHNHGILYLGTCVFGASLSSVYPTTISLAESYINVTSYITTILVVCAASGEMIFPVIIGHEFETIGPSSILISGVIMTVLSFAIFVFLYLVIDSVVGQSEENNLSTRLKKAVLSPTRGDTEDFLKRNYTRMESDLSDDHLADVRTEQLTPSQEQPTSL